MVTLQRDNSEQGVYQAARDCGHCAQCGRELKPAEPVWREVFQFYKKRMTLGACPLPLHPSVKSVSSSTTIGHPPNPVKSASGWS